MAPAAYSPGANDAFASGVNHLTTGRANTSSVTLDGGLQADSDRQSGMSPHGVLGTAMSGGQDDGSWERFQRTSGGYQPGQMENFQDQLDQGSDNQT